MSKANLITELNELIAQFNRLYTFQGQDWPMVEHQPDWPSVCEKGPLIDDKIGWQPQPMTEPLDFEPLESALNFVINEDIKTYYACVYSADIRCRAAQGDLDLILLWNKDDFERLQQNFVGHLLMKQRLKQRATLFFAHTDEDDLFLSVVNATGEVVLERPGLEPHETVAPNLASFIGMLTAIKS